MTDLTITIIVSTLTILLFIGLVVLLLVLSNDRRNRHRAELAEVRARHAEAVREVEQEVLAHTLTEVGRDLHDNIGQLLTVMRLGVNGILATDPENTRASEVKANLDSAIAEVRRLSRELNVDRWEELSLVQSIQQECERVRRAGGVVTVQDDGQEQPLTSDQKLVLFRIFQEALNNALKHAGATSITVELTGAAGFQLVIRDNGRGIAEPAAGGAHTGQGLANMQRRATLIGFHCTVSSQLGQGTTITVGTGPTHTNSLV